MQNIISKIKKELIKLSDEKVKDSDRRFFREEIKTYGVRTPVVRKLANEYFKEIKDLEKAEIFELCEELLQGGYNQEATIAIQWCAKLKNKFELADFEIFERWLNEYIDNWAKDDDFCLHLVNPIINKFPELIKKIKGWSKSKNQWVRRASAVSFISTIDGFYASDKKLEDIFEVADNLMADTEDLVQKGYGWLLKATSVHRQKQVFDYVMKNKDKMTRTALRYAIEKMPKEFRNEAMKK